jgi:adenine deaminase
VLNADGLVVALGIIDNHTHYDAQVTWDPLCTYSCYHGITTVVMGNCSLAMAPRIRKIARCFQSLVPWKRFRWKRSKPESTGPKRFPSISMLWINGWALTSLPS